jgi:membrane-associated phospholipid phosphatase
LANKVWEVGLGAVTLESTRRLTNAFKDVSREHLNKRSFPSAHTARAAVGSTLAVRYVDFYAVPGWARNTLKGALIALPYATGWARMEAGVHVPSDVLAGVAWGNFFGVLVNGLLDARMLSPVSVTVLPWEKGAMLRVDIRY